jgi:23S rRNA (uracil1939-C5)-methyltransferase
VVAVDGCLVAHPLVRDVVDRGHFGSAREITVRAGVATGERLVRVDRAGVVDDVDVPAGVVVVGPNGRAFIHEEVAGHRFRVSVGSFFQARPDGAAALVDAVAEAAGDVRGRTFVDLYAGVGLFAATVGRAAREVVAVEGSASASADARHNVPDAKVVHGDVNRWKPVAADVVVADPSRAGLGADAVDRIVATGAARVVLVSCDAAALGRDANLLAQRGYELVRATLVDLFPLTSHVEVVTTYVRGAGVGTAARTD